MFKNVIFTLNTYIKEFSMRVYNFSAGPSMLPLEVLEKVQAGLIDYEGTGMSVMEMSHRSKPYEKINADAEALLRELMNIPDELLGYFRSGRRVHAIRGGSAQPRARLDRNERRLRRNRQLLGKGV